MQAWAFTKHSQIFVPCSYIYASPLCSWILSWVAFLERLAIFHVCFFLSSRRLKFQTNPTLKYLYPPPSSGILTNISHTLLSVPKFYVQVSRDNKVFFSPVFFCCFIYQFMLGMCKQAHLYDYLLCTSISLPLLGF